MAKRSPILGYNHNVLYRGLIFHVQTEDSGLLSPHLFTHLFHSGVIISTRKLVYDAGSAEDAIKSLMQAQHKAVLKDLKRHAFDDKIDLYLAGTPGLLPRDAPGATPETAEQPPLTAAGEPAAPVPAAPHAPLDATATQPLEIIDLLPPLAIARTATPPPIPLAARRSDTELDVAPRGAVARTQTADRTSGPGSGPRSQQHVVVPPPPPPPAPDELDPPTLSDNTAASIAAAIAAANAHTMSRDFQVDSSPEIEIQLELDEPDEEPVRRRTRDTDIALPGDLESDGIPGMVGARPDAFAPPASTPYVPPTRPSSVVGASLPAARPVTRPPSRPSVTAPPIVARPLPVESDAVEVYSQAPPSVDAPPGAGGERPGTYSQHRRTNRIPLDPKDRSGAIPIPAGLGRPGRASNPMPTPAIGVPRTGAPSSPPGAGSGSIPVQTVSGAIPVLRGPDTTEPIASRTPTASRPTPAAARTSSGSGGVVMTRPAVIVGAPSKQTQALPRVRKAREDEGRGFGQGLISEKSLDEVILAYLSEDADDK